MPDHSHAIWALPEDDRDFATRWMLIKQAFSRGIAAEERTSLSRGRKGERGIWQRRYWEHAIRDERDLRNHIDYIHFNPMKHGHCVRARDWPYSSFHRYVDSGLLPADWSGECVGRVSHSPIRSSDEGASPRCAHQAKNTGETRR